MELTRLESHHILGQNICFQVLRILVAKKFPGIYRRLFLFDGTSKFGFHVLSKAAGVFFPRQTLLSMILNYHCLLLAIAKGQQNFHIKHSCHAEQYLDALRYFIVKMIISMHSFAAVCFTSTCLFRCEIIQALLSCFFKNASIAVQCISKL